MLECSADNVYIVWENYFLLYEHSTEEKRKFSIFLCKLFINNPYYFVINNKYFYNNALRYFRNTWILLQLKLMTDLTFFCPFGLVVKMTLNNMTVKNSQLNFFSCADFISSKAAMILKNKEFDFLNIWFDFFVGI